MNDEEAKLLINGRGALIPIRLFNSSSAVFNVGKWVQILRFFSVRPLTSLAK